ncbi:MAG TPA: hypothetical protein VMV38_00170 [Candidatus Paceibacterota bacterium]|nr:hypothetical protein [Candidatus Paceibacterota bacterium]
MIRTSSYELKPLSTAIQHAHDFIVVGEMHGSKQNAPLMQELLSIMLTGPKPVTIAFEWTLSNSECDALRAYIYGDDVPVQLPAFFLDSDGRFTPEHIPFLKWIRAYNSTHNNLINLHTFDDPNKNSGESDQAMANSLCTYKEQHPDSLILVETGNMHARNLPYVSGGTEYVPMAAILKKKYDVFSIFLQYLQGEILVEGKNRDVTKAASQQEGPGRYFDAVLEIPISEAAKNPDSLTKIAKLL